MQNYIESHFHDGISEAMDSYLLNIKDIEALDLRYKKILKIDSLELSAVNIENVKVGDLPGTLIEFNIAVSCEITAYGIKGSGYIGKESVLKWFTINGIGDIANGLNKIKIKGIYPYERERFNSALDDDLVPVLSKEDLEEKASEIICDYYPEVLKGEVLNAEVFAERLGLKVEKRKLSLNQSIFGKIFFAPTITFVYTENGEKKEERVKEGTILIDPETCHKLNSGRQGFTIVHECVHWILHKKAVMFHQLYASEIKSIECHTDGEIIMGKDTTQKWMEWQANALAACLLVPSGLLIAETEKELACDSYDCLNRSRVDDLKIIIENLSCMFSVSKEIIKIRLLDNGYDDVRGIDEFVDGHYVATYSYKQGTLGERETFTISQEEAVSLSIENIELKELLKDGDYLFLDNHFVYNTPLYVNYNKKGKLVLTKYALSHMEECCLIFSNEPKKKMDIDPRFSCVLYRKEPSHVYKEMYTGKTPLTPDEQIKLRQNEFDEDIEIRKRMTEDPSQCLKLLMEEGKDGRNGKKEKVLIKQLAADVECDERTISRFLSGETTNPSKVVVLRICFALKLSPILSSKLLDVFGIKLSYINSEDVYIQEALNTKYPEGLENVEEYLDKFNVSIKR